MAVGPKTFYAKWNVNDYTVTFDSKTGSAVPSATVAFGTTITQPANPTKTGHVFKGWYTDETYTTMWNFTTQTMPANNMTLYAKWQWDETTQDPLVLIDIPSNIDLDELAGQTGSTQVKAQKTSTISVIQNANTQWLPDKDVKINTQRTFNLTKNGISDVFPVEVYKADNTLYTPTDTALMTLNTLGNGKPNSSTFTLKTLVDPSKQPGTFNGVMTFTVVLE